MRSHLPLYSVLTLGALVMLTWPTDRIPVVHAQSTCAVPVTFNETNDALRPRWANGQCVRVVAYTGDFTGPEIAQMNSILNEFESGGEIGCAHVTFADIVEEMFERADSPAGDPAADNTLYLLRRCHYEMPSELAHQSGRGTSVVDSNGEPFERWRNAVIVIRQYVTMQSDFFAEQFIATFRHEVGHSFGLTHGDQDFPCSVTMMCRGAPGSGITFCDSQVLNRVYCSAASDAAVQLNAPGVCPTVSDTVVQFEAPGYSVGEADGSATITVTRTGNTAYATSVDFATSDNSALSRTDYNAVRGTLNFAPGETSKTFSVFITNDAFIDNSETFNLTLSRATGAMLGTPAAASVTITDNDATAPTTNPVDENTFFVRQHYIDFLGREPDLEGLAHWLSQLTNCRSSDPLVCRVQVSAEFFRSIEFQNTGYLAYRTHGAAFGRTRIGALVPLTLNDFLPDVRRLGRDIVVGRPNWETQLEANKVAYFNEFVVRADFIATYPSRMTPEQFVDALNTNAGGLLSTEERKTLSDELTFCTKTRAQVLRAVVENSNFSAAQFNRAFVLMEYFGYLRRDLDAVGYTQWLNKLNRFNGDYLAAEMVKAFITSIEYRQRFGRP